MRPVRLGALVAALSLVSGHGAWSQSGPVHGGQVRITLASSGVRLRGELIAVSPDSVWVLQGSTLLSVPSSDIRRAQVKRRPIGAEGILLWGLIGGTVSGVALGAACGSFDDGGSCGGVLPAVLLSWGLFAGLWAGVAGSAYSSYSAAFARFPQGLPSPWDPAWLLRTPPDTGRVGRAP